MKTSKSVGEIVLPKQPMRGPDIVLFQYLAQLTASLNCASRRYSFGNVYTQVTPMIADHKQSV